MDDGGINEFVVGANSWSSSEAEAVATVVLVSCTIDKAGGLVG